MSRTKILLGAVLVLMATLAMPTAANARTPADEARCGTMPSALAPNRTGTFACAAGTFGAGEPVRFTITGTSGARVPVALPGPADVAANGSSATTVRRAGAHGGVSIPLRALSHGGGTFTVTVSGASRSVTSRLSVLPTGSAVVQSEPTPSADLAAVGSRVDSVFGWVAAIIAVFAAAAVLSERRSSRRGNTRGSGAAEA